MGAAHPFGDVFSVLSQDGLVDAKAFEIHDILQSFVSDTAYHPDFEDGLRAAEVVDAILRSAESRSWIDLKEAE
jgi:predicted dehydrogenase